MTETRDAPVRARLAHLCRGRARLRLTGKPSPTKLERLAEAVSAAPGARRVLARPATGSVILEADAPAEALRAFLEQAQGVRLERPAAPPPVGQVARFGMMRMDREIRGRTAGSLDFRTTLALLLAAGAAVQLARGQVAGPATTLMMGALSLIPPPES